MTACEKKKFPIIFATENRQYTVTFKGQNIAIKMEFLEALDIAIKFSEIFRLPFDQIIQESVNFLLMYCYNIKKKLNNFVPVLEQIEKINKRLAESQDAEGNLNEEDEENLPEF